MDTAVMHLTKPFWLLALGLGCLLSSAREYEGTRANSILQQVRQVPLWGRFETTVAGTREYADKPVFAFETSWEATPGKLTPDQVRTGAWGSLMGGAFYLYAECFEPTLTRGDGRAFGFIEVMNDFLSGLAYFPVLYPPSKPNGWTRAPEPGRRPRRWRAARSGCFPAPIHGTGSCTYTERNEEGPCSQPTRWLPR